MMPSILFVCSRNRFRSVIAEAQFREHLLFHNAADDWQVKSAGTWVEPDLPPIPQAVKFCRQHGWMVEDIRSMEVNKVLLAHASLVLTMTQGQNEALCIDFPEVKKKIFLLSEVCENQLYDVSDPVNNPDVTWEEVGNEVCSLVTHGFSNICRIAMKGEPNLPC